MKNIWEAITEFKLPLLGLNASVFSITYTNIEDALKLLLLLFSVIISAKTAYDKFFSKNKKKKSE